MLHATRTRPVRRHTTFAVSLLLLASGGMIGCSDVTAPAPAASMQASVEVMFNPQPDPPMEMLKFAIDNPNLLGDPRGLTGRLLDALGREGGTLDVIAIQPTRVVGQTMHLNLRWTFIGDGNNLPAVLPAVQVSGILNLASGQLVLNGVADDGRRVHVRGQTGPGGTLFGELMFNPQPDPPLEG